MFEEVRLRGIKCFGPDGATLGPLVPVNLIFGPNGSGKTSISRAIENPDAFAGTQITMGPSESEIFVYNRDYVASTFGTSDMLPGIFMLGDNASETITAIESKTGLLKQAKEHRDRTHVQLNGSDEVKGQRDQLEGIRRNYTDIVWRARDLVPEAIDETIRRGTKNNRKQFFENCENVADKYSDSECSLQELVDDAETFFNSDAEPSALVPAFTGSLPDKAEIERVLSLKIVGSQDSSLSALIQRLGNQNWVQEGVDHFNAADGVCPFCQEVPREDFVDDLTALFDADFAASKARAEQLEQDCREFQRGIADYVALNAVKMREAVGEREADEAISGIQSLAKDLVDTLESKLGALGTAMAVPSFAGRDTTFADAISKTNDCIRETNDALRHREQKTKDLTVLCWRAFVRDTLAEDTAAYIAKRDAQKVRVNDLENELAVQKAADNELEADLIQLQTRS